MVSPSPSFGRHGLQRQFFGDGAHGQVVGRGGAFHQAGAAILGQHRQLPASILFAKLHQPHPVTPSVIP